jgi:predicted nucleic acid binding AN1-type Zn finger protein
MEKSWEEFLEDFKSKMKKSFEKYPNKGREEDSFDSDIVDLTNIESLSSIVEIENCLVGGSNEDIYIIHESKKPFKCLICKKAYSSKQNLQIHTSAIHERKKPFGCQICNKFFSRKATLNIHIKNCSVLKVKLVINSFRKNATLNQDIKNVCEEKKNKVASADTDSCPDRPFRYVMNYQDHYIKFLHKV